MNDTISIPKDLAQAGIVHFVESSVLADCTTTATDEYDRVAVTSSWPTAGFSTGEIAAWSTLRSLVDGELRRFLNTLDADNIGALIACLAFVRGEVMV